MDGCKQALALHSLLAVHILEAALLVVVVVELAVGADVLVGLVVGDVVVEFALLFTSALSTSAPNKVVWGLPGSKSCADCSTMMPLAALISTVAGVDAVQVPKMASISL